MFNFGENPSFIEDKIMKAAPAPAPAVAPAVDIVFITGRDYKDSSTVYDDTRPDLILEWVNSYYPEPSRELTEYLASRPGVTATPSQVSDHLNEARSLRFTESACLQALSEYLDYVPSGEASGPGLLMASKGYTSEMTIEYYQY